MRIGRKSLLNIFFNSLKTERVQNSSQVTAGVVLRKYVDNEEISPALLETEKSLVLESGFFDASYYLRHNKDVLKSGMDPLDHFAKYGSFEGRNPGRRFNSKYYLAHNPDVREAYISPLLHYLLIGEKQKRRIAPSSRRKRTNDSKQIDIINVNFYDWDGKVLYKGGAERYVYDLAKLLSSMGFEPRILQNATTSFEKRYRGISVVGVKTNSDTLRGMSSAFSKATKGARLVIASPLDLACEIRQVPVVGINHGIHWDTIKNEISNLRNSEYEDIFDALENVDRGVCVDTNFINWVRTCDYSYGMKLKYVPNYYDAQDFKGRNKNFKEELVFTYPRRLYDARGIYITVDAFRRLLKKHSKMRLNLVGQTSDPSVMRAVKKLIEEFPDSVSLREYPMEEMHKAYDSSHVVIIPTRYSEGTSLSCIEGMATNNALIATNVGGLSNLVINRFNGMLIEPTSNSLYDAVEEMMMNRDLVNDMARNGAKMVSVFDKKYWEKSWIELIKEVTL